MSSVKFDNTEILNTTYLPRFVQHESAPERELSSIELAREDGAIIVSDRYGSKRVLLQGVLVGTSANDLDDKIDIFKELFGRFEKNLDIVWNGGTRRYVASCVRHSFERDHYHITHIPWSAEFIISSGEGKDTSATTVVNAEAITTTTPGTKTFTIYGSKGPRPTITVAMNYAVSHALGVKVRNTTTGESIIATRGTALANGDAFKFYCYEKKVTFTPSGGSEVEIDFYGNFPTFIVGSNTVEITVGSLINQQTEQAAADFGTNKLTMNTSNIIGAQSFIVPYTDGSFMGIAAALKKTGSPGSFTWRIETDAGNEPSGNLVTANATGIIAEGDMGASVAYCASEYVYDQFSLAANTRYWLRAVVGGADVSNYVEWYNDPALYPYGSYSYSTDGGSNFTNVPGYDLGFRILHGGLSEASSVKLTVAYYKTYL